MKTIRRTMSMNRAAHAAKEATKDHVPKDITVFVNGMPFTMNTRVPTTLWQVIHEHGMGGKVCTGVRAYVFRRGKFRRKVIAYRPGDHRIYPGDSIILLRVELTRKECRKIIREANRVFRDVQSTQEI